MQRLRTLLLSAVLAFTVLAASIQQTQAVLPVLVYAVARQAVYMTAESVAIGVIAKGFAANDPYVRTTATLPRSTFARNISKLRGPRWVGVLALLATVAGLGWDYDQDVGLYTPVRSVPDDGVCETDPSQVGADACLQSGMRRNPYLESTYPCIFNKLLSLHIFLLLNGVLIPSLLLARLVMLLALVMLRAINILNLRKIFTSSLLLRRI